MGIIFSGPQLYLALFFGVFPDLIPFGANIIVSLFRPKSRFTRNYQDIDVMRSYYDQPENQWVYKLYNWTHSLVLWGLTFLVVWLIGSFYNFFPLFLLLGYFMFLLIFQHIPADFFAPQFLTPLSHFNVNGISWGTKWFMILNYTSLVLFLILRLTGNLGTIPIP